MSVHKYLRRFADPLFNPVVKGPARPSPEVTGVGATTNCVSRACLRPETLRGETYTYKTTTRVAAFVYFTHTCFPCI